MIKMFVELGTVGIGEDTARIGVKVSKEQCNIDAAEEMFCGKRLSIRLEMQLPGEAEGQGVLFDGAKPSITASVKVRRWSSGPKAVTFGLTFDLTSCDVNALAHFAKRNATLYVNSVDGVLDEHEAGEEEPALA